MICDFCMRRGAGGGGGDGGGGGVGAVYDIQCMQVVFRSDMHCIRHSWEDIEM